MTKGSTLLLAYVGDYDAVEHLVAKLGELYPRSPYNVDGLGESTIGEYCQRYDLLKRDTRYLLSYAVSKRLFPRMYAVDTALDAVMINSDNTFPFLFSEKSFMNRFVAKVQIALYGKNKRLKKYQFVSRHKLKNTFDALDEIYARVTQLEGLPYYNTDRVKSAMDVAGKAQAGGARIASYREAVELVRKLSRNERSEDKHYVVAAVIKQNISNKKPMNENDCLFSPEELFSKGYGVCSDQAPAFASILGEVGIPQDYALYLWFRKAYWNHLDMIYRNADGRYYIFDNYGIGNYSFTSRDEAEDFHKDGSLKYIRSVSITKGASGNQSWSNLEQGRSSTVSSSDRSITVMFGSENVITKH